MDASPDRAIVVAGAWLTDGGVHVELLAADVAENAVQWLVQRAGRRIPVVIDGASPAAAMIPGDVGPA